MTDFSASEAQTTTEAEIEGQDATRRYRVTARLTEPVFKMLEARARREKRSLSETLTACVVEFSHTGDLQVVRGALLETAAKMVATLNAVTSQYGDHVYQENRELRQEIKELREERTVLLRLLQTKMGETK